MESKYKKFKRIATIQTKFRINNAAECQLFSPDYIDGYHDKMWGITEPEYQKVKCEMDNLIGETVHKFKEELPGLIESQHDLIDEGNFPNPTTERRIKYLKKAIASFAQT